jgi:hypothetical protein
MNRSTRKFFGYIRLVVSLLLVISVAGVLYYFEIQRRAGYFEQLRFRQLKEFVQSFDNNLASLRSVTREHAQLVDQDLSELRWLQGKLNSLPKDKPYGYSSEKLKKLVHAQAALLSFGDRQYTSDKTVVADQLGQPDTESDRECIKEPPASGIDSAPSEDSELYKNLLKRAELPPAENENVFSREKCTDNKDGLETNKKDINDLSEVMNIAGCLGRIPPQHVVDDHFETAKTQITTLEGMQSLNDICTAKTIRHNLLTALKIFHSQSTTSNDENVTNLASKERLSHFIQNQIEMFWSGELTRENRDQRERDFRVAAALATENEIEKSRQSLERIIRIVESSYLSESSPLAASVQKHRLRLKYELSSEPDARELCATNNSGALFLLPTTQSGPYPGGSYSLGACAQNSSVAYTAPLEHFLESDIDEFSVIMIADPEGNVLYSMQSRETSKGQTFLNVRELISDQSDTSTNELGNTKNVSLHSLERSGVRTLSISGTEYRLYVLPYRLRADRLLAYSSAPSTQGPETQTKSIDRFYLIGMIPLSQVNAEKLSLSTVSAVSLLVISVTILLLFVFLKIRWVPLSAAFTPGDRRIAAIVIVAMVMLGSLVWISVLVSNRISDDFEREANRATDILRSSFSNDLENIFESVGRLQEDGLFRSVLFGKNNLEKTKEETDRNSANQTVLDCSHKAISTVPEIRCVRDAAASLFGQPKVAWYLGCGLSADKKGRALCWSDSAPIDNIFVLNKGGRIKGSLIRGTRKLVAPVVNPNLSQREYFRKAVSGDFWRIRLDQTPGSESAQTQATPVHMERIFNIVNGSLTTQFAIPISTLCLAKSKDKAYSQFCKEYSNRTEKMGESGNLIDYELEKSNYKVLSFGATLRSLLSPLLPHRFNFAVIDNATGEVLYHSTPSRSLVENFIQETENNAQLQSYLRKANAGLSVPNAEAFKFDGRYRGARTRFYAKQLHADIPWTVLLFHEMEYAQAFTSLLFTLSILISLSLLALITGIAFLTKLFYHDIFVWLWPDIDMEHWYRNTAVGVLIASVALLFILEHVDSLCRIFFLLGLLFISSVWLLGTSFASFRSTPIIPAHLGSNSRVTNFYTFFVMSLLIFWVAIPSLSISKIVGDSLIKRLEMYDGLVMEERRKASEDIIRSHLEMRFDNPEKSLYQPYSIVEHACPCVANRDTGSRILTRVSDKPDCHRITHSGEHKNPERADKLSHETAPDIVFHHALSMISIVWPPASLLTNDRNDERAYTVAEEQAAEKSSTTAEQKIVVPWKAAYKYPRLSELISFNGHYVYPLLTYASLLIVIFFLVRFLATNLLGMSVPRSYRTKPEVWKVRLD